MTTATLVAGNRTTDRPRRTLEELVDNLIDALFQVNAETEVPSATRSIHEAGGSGRRVTWTPPWRCWET